MFKKMGRSSNLFNKKGNESSLFSKVVKAGMDAHNNTVQKAGNFITKTNNALEKNSSK